MNDKYEISGFMLAILMILAIGALFGSGIEQKQSKKELCEVRLSYQPTASDSLQIVRDFGCELK